MLETIADNVVTLPRENPGEVNIKPIADGGPMLFDWARLQRAYADKDISVRTYVKWALQILYGAEGSFIDLDVNDLASSLSGSVEDSWGEIKLIEIADGDVLKAIGELSKKQFLESTVNLQLTLHF